VLGFKSFRTAAVTLCGIELIHRIRKRLGKPAVSSKTIKNHFIIISKILKHAFKLGYSDKIPIFPTVTWRA
jgi:hypothetical protein